MFERKQSYKGYVRLGKDVFESEAYLSLKPVERALLLEFGYLSTPQTNGKLSICSTAKKDEGKISYAMQLLNASDIPVRRAFWVLEERGFIRLTKSHSFKQKLVREYALTIHQVNGREPTNECLEWKQGDNFCKRKRPSTLE